MQEKEETLHNAVGIIITENPPEDIKHVEKPMSHCQCVALARKGEKIIAGNKDISCPLAKYYLGLSEKNEKNLFELKETLVSWGDTANTRTSELFLADFPALPYSKRRFFLYFPYPDSKLEPDIIVRILKPVDIFHWLLENTKYSGDRIKPNMSGVGAICGECTVFPYVTGKPNVSMGCDGSRRRALLNDHEMLLAIPVKPVFNSR